MITHVITIANAVPSSTGPIDAHAFSAFLADLCPDANTNVDLTTNNGVALCLFMAGDNRGCVVSVDNRFILETVDGGVRTASHVMDSMDDIREAIRGYFKSKEHEVSRPF